MKIIPQNQQLWTLWKRLNALGDFACFYPKQYEEYCSAPYNQSIISQIIDDLSENEDFWKLAPAALSAEDRAKLLKIIKSKGRLRFFGRLFGKSLKMVFIGFYIFSVFDHIDLITVCKDSV